MFFSNVSQKCLAVALLLTVAFVKDSVGKNCNFDFDCDSNQSCQSKLCECHMGFSGVPNGLNQFCTPIVCQTNYNCANFPHTKCGIHGKCECEDGYQLDSKNHACQKGITAPATQQTPIVPIAPTIQTIPKKSCIYDSECFQFADSQCKENICTCRNNFYFDSKSNKCVMANVINNGQLANNSCKNSFDCGLNSYCDSANKCQCKFGFMSDINQRDCTLKRCSINLECQQMSGHSVCDFGQCKCLTGYQLDSSSQQCQLKKSTPNSCNYDDQCGAFSVCIKNQCKCLLGYISPWVEGWNGCSPLKCTSNYDCTSIASGTKCQNEKCVCEDDFSFDSSNQSCINPYSTTRTPTTTLKPLCQYDRNCPPTFVCNNNNKCECPIDKYLDSMENICHLIHRPDYPEPKHSGMGTGAIVGIGIGTSVVMVGIIILIWHFCCRTRVTVDRQRQTVSNNSVGASTQPSAPSASPNLIRPNMNTTGPQSTNPFDQYQIPVHQPSYNPAYISSGGNPTIGQPNYQINPNIGIKVYPTLPNE